MLNLFYCLVSDGRLLAAYIIIGGVIILIICCIFIALIASIVHVCLHIKVRRLQTKLNQLQSSIDS